MGESRAPDVREYEVSRCDVIGRPAVWYDTCDEIRLSTMAPSGDYQAQIGQYDLMV